MRVRTVGVLSGVIVSAALAASCSGESPDEEVGEDTSALCSSSSSSSGTSGTSGTNGQSLFTHALAGTNGRACATCHAPGNHFTLGLADVASRAPNDPLFNPPIDADDPTVTRPTFRHLGAGLIRVTLTLADNLDVVDANGNVITNAARTIDVWRGVPSAENTAYTAPYQFDGRFATLQIQADAALHGHSQIDHEPTAAQLNAITAFEQGLFSGDTARNLAAALASGQHPHNVEQHFPLGSQEHAGQALFEGACAGCHGTPTQTVIVNQAVHDQLFPVLNADGTVTTTTVPDGTSTTTVAAHVHHDLQSHQQVNIGIAFGTYLGQIGAVPNFTGVDFPKYRIRFYTNASRHHKVVDLPPQSGVGPTLAPQAWSVDPGRAITTGDPADWEAFDVPQLRGIKNTAPYFHDNSAPDLKTVVDFYSRFILPVIPELGLPAVLPPEGTGLPPESLTPTQKSQIITYLDTL